MSDVTFGKSTVWDTTTGESAIDVFRNGEDVGTIEKEVQDVGGTSFEWRTEGYQVSLYVGEDVEDRYFSVKDHGTARKALAAAKAYVRRVVA